MVRENEHYLSERSEYHIRVPKVPRQTVEVFGRNIKDGNYGLSAESVDVLHSYVNLQRTLSTFDDLTFSPDFLGKLPEEIKTKLGDNLFPGIALADLEVPTSDKVLLARMLAADRLTDSLSQEPVEIWVSPQIQKDLDELGTSVNGGMQRVDYDQLSLKAKLELVEVMEHQEAQAHTILAARQHFPRGVPPLGIGALLSGQKERTRFDAITDFEAQYNIARQALGDPIMVMISEGMEEKRDERRSQASQKPEEGNDVRLKDILDDFPIEIEEEAKGRWWDMSDQYHDFDRYDKVIKGVAEFLRPKYADKSIYEILGAEDDASQAEILAAFWRTGKSRTFYFGDKATMVHDLYLNPDGNLELHYHDEIYGDRENSTISGPLTNDLEVGMADQAIKWIQEEKSDMQKVREKWEKSGLEPNPLVETTVAIALGLDRSAAIQEQIDGLPKWFVDALNQEATYFNRLIRYVPQPSINDLLSFMPMTRSHENRLKTFFDLSNARLDRDRRLIANPQELYQDLDLDPSADAEQVKQAYRKIAQETKEIHIGSEADFDPQEWQNMNDRFKRATRAYSALSRRKLGETRITTLGRINSYFEDASQA